MKSISFIALALILATTSARFLQNRSFKPNIRSPPQRNHHDPNNGQGRSTHDNSPWHAPPIDKKTVATNPSAGGQAGIYGIAGVEYEDGSNSLVYYDTSSGSATTLVEGDSSYLTGQGLGCIDSVNGIIYFIYEMVESDESIEVGLYGYDLNNPTTNTIDPISLPMLMPQEFVGAGDACLSDPNTGDLYVFGHSVNDTTVQLLIRISRDSQTMDVTTTIVTEYSGLDDIPLLSGSCTVYDSKRNKMWIPSSVGDNTNDIPIDWFYIDARSGTIEKNISDLAWTMPTCSYDAALDKIIGIEFNSEERDGNLTFVLKQADPVTLEITSNFDPIYEWCDYTSVDTYNTVDSVQYQIIFKNPFGACVDTNGTLIGHLVGMDANTGQLMSSPEMCTSLLDCPWSMEYWAGSSK